MWSTGSSTSRLLLEKVCLGSAVSIVFLTEVQFGNWRRIGAKFVCRFPELPQGQFCLHLALTVWRRVVSYRNDKLSWDAGMSPKEFPFKEAHKPLAVTSVCDSAVSLILIKHLTGFFFGFVLQEEIIPVFSSVRCLYIWWSAPDEQTSKIWTEEAASALVFEPRRLQVSTSSHHLPLKRPWRGLGFLRYQQHC